MPPHITIQDAYDRLFDVMPDWRTRLLDQTFVRDWQNATGDSRATAYRMEAHALEIDDALWQAWRTSHRELSGEELIVAHNRHWGIPCRWLGEAA